MSNSNNVKFSIYAIVHYVKSDGDHASLTTELNFNKGTEEWQYKSCLVDMPTGAISITSITVGADYSNNINAAVFDKISLSPCTAIDLNQTEDEIVDDTEEEQEDQTSYTYDDNDNVTSTTLTINGLTISTSSIYDNSSNLLSYTNELGQTTTYSYNNENELTAITDAENHTVYYTDTTITAGTSQIVTTENGNTKTISANGNIYTIVYNDNEQIESVSVGNTTLVSYTYNEEGSLQAKTYANGDVENYTYNILGNETTKHLNNSIKSKNIYDGNGNLIETREETKTVKNIYSVTGEQLATRTVANGYTLYTYTDEDGNDIDILDGTVLNNRIDVTKTTDAFDRTVSETNGVVTESYSYITDSDNNTSYTVNEKTVSYGNESITYSYTYDNVGNITSVSDGIYTTTYEYNELYELVRENNQKANKTWTYSYDNNGNILSKSEYTYTITDLTNITPDDTISYGYTNTDWTDQLTSYDGTSITYDESGKPLNWTDNRNLTWEGTTLTSIGNTNYIYDAGGILQSVGNNDISYDSKGNIESYKGITYKYDESGKPIGFGDNYFIYNQEGDVVKIYNTTLNSIVITYDYDAFGNVVNTTYRNAMYDNLSQKNIFKYRGSYGYFYEINSDTYYLKTRFYDPQAGRFLSPDNTDYLGATGTVLSYDLYCYCENNAVNAVDPSGNTRILYIYDAKDPDIAQYSSIEISMLRNRYGHSKMCAPVLYHLFIRLNLVGIIHSLIVILIM